MPIKIAKLGRSKHRICKIDVTLVRSWNEQKSGDGTFTIRNAGGHISRATAARLAAAAGVEVPTRGYDRVLPGCNARLYHGKSGFTISTAESGRGFAGTKSRRKARR